MVKKTIPAKNKSLKSNSSYKKPVEKNPKVLNLRTIDASGKILGRLSTEVANILRGKDKPSFLPYLVMGDRVVVTNAKKIKVTGNKMKDKYYYRHTGYIGHLKTTSMEEIYKKDPGELIRRSVYGMLPKNKLRDLWMKNLEVRNGE